MKQFAIVLLLCCLKLNGVWAWNLNLIQIQSPYYSRPLFLQLDKVIYSSGTDCLKDADNNTSSILESETPMLFQNQPNPFTSRTAIRYFLPEAAQSAEIRINSMSGVLVKTIKLIQKGNSVTNLEANELKPALYLYSLMVNGKVVDTKKMTLVGN